MEDSSEITLTFGSGHGDLLAHLDAQPDKSGYLRRLIADDMARSGGAVAYEIDAAGGPVSLTVTGVWGDGSADIEAEVDGGETRGFGGDETADDVMSWLLGEGVEFESAREAYMHWMCIGAMMHGESFDDAETEAEAVPEGEIAKWFEESFGANA